MIPLTYVQFHAVFVVPALSVLVAAVGVRSPRRHDVRAVPTVAILVLALAYTVPWDNYLIQRGVWSYGTGRVAAVVWHAPVEEYLFILLQPLIVVLWLYHVSDGRVRSTTVTWRQRAGGALAGLAVAGGGAVLLTAPGSLYLGAILAWAGPVLALQWAVGWPYLLARWQTVLFGVAGPTGYLWVADWIALRTGVWSLSPAHTTGLSLFGLPIEEAVFFLVTNLFVVQGLVLYPWVVERWR